jgi:hypothetical protein
VLLVVSTLRCNNRVYSIFICKRGRPGRTQVIQFPDTPNAERFAPYHELSNDLLKMRSAWRSQGRAFTSRSRSQIRQLSAANGGSLEMDLNSINDFFATGDLAGLEIDTLRYVLDTFVNHRVIAAF